jgi:hypothetical protein
MDGLDPIEGSKGQSWEQRTICIRSLSRKIDNRAVHFELYINRTVPSVRSMALDKTKCLSTLRPPSVRGVLIDVLTMCFHQGLWLWYLSNTTNG